MTNIWWFNLHKWEDSLLRCSSNDWILSYFVAYMFTFASLIQSFVHFLKIYLRQYKVLLISWVLIIKNAKSSLLICHFWQEVPNTKIFCFCFCKTKNKPVIAAKCFCVYNWNTFWKCSHAETTVDGSVFFLNNITLCHRCVAVNCCFWSSAGKHVSVCTNSPNESFLLPLALAAPVVQRQLLCPGQKSWAVCFVAPRGEVSVSPSKLQGGRGDKQVRCKDPCWSINCGMMIVVTRVSPRGPWRGAMSDSYFIKASPS